MTFLPRSRSKTRGDSQDTYLSHSSDSTSVFLQRFTHIHTPFHISNLICATTNMSWPRQIRKASALSYQSLQGANVLLLFLDFAFVKRDQHSWQHDASLSAPILSSTIGFVPQQGSLPASLAAPQDETLPDSFGNGQAQYELFRNQIVNIYELMGLAAALPWRSPQNDASGIFCIL